MKTEIFLGPVLKETLLHVGMVMQYVDYRWSDNLPFISFVLMACLIPLIK